MFSNTKYLVLLDYSIVSVCRRFNCVPATFFVCSFCAVPLLCIDYCCMCRRKRRIGFPSLVPEDNLLFFYSWSYTEIQLVQQGPGKFQSVCGRSRSTEVDYLIDFFQRNSFCCAHWSVYSHRCGATVRIQCPDGGFCHPSRLCGWRDLFVFFLFFSFSPLNCSMNWQTWCIVFSVVSPFCHLFCLEHSILYHLQM